MSRTNEGKESETNEDKQKNKVQDTFITLLSLKVMMKLTQYIVMLQNTLSNKRGQSKQQIHLTYTTKTS